MYTRKMLREYLIFLSLFMGNYGSPISERNVTNDEKRPTGGLTTYDQRQTGKYNVHVNIKDVQFFSLSDSLSSIGGDYPDYEDYSDIDLFGGTETDYDTAHLTVNPIFAFLGSNKPTTAKPPTSSSTTTLKSTSSPSSSTEKLPGTMSSSSSTFDVTTAASTVASTVTEEVNKQESESEDEENKPASNDDKKPLKEAAIEYEEIPVEVQYFRTQQKSPSNRRQVVASTAQRFHKRPSVQIIDDHGRINSVKVLENEHPTVRICNRGEFRDGTRCRQKPRTRRGVPGLRRLFNLFSSFKAGKN